MFATLLATGFLRSTPAAGVGTVLYYASSLALIAVALGRVIRGLPTHTERQFWIRPLRPRCPDENRKNDQPRGAWQTAGSLSSPGMLTI